MHALGVSTAVGNYKIVQDYKLYNSKLYSLIATATH